VIERSGPGPLDPSSLAWTYHSDAAGAQDIYSGLVGATIVYRPGELDKHTLEIPAPPGSNLIEEVLTLFLIFDENQSYYIDQNTLNKTNITLGQLQVNRADQGFQQSNMKHSINGRMFGNLFGLNFTAGKDARWHVVCQSHISRNVHELTQTLGGSGQRGQRAHTSLAREYPALGAAASGCCEWSTPVGNVSTLTSDQISVLSAQTKSLTMVVDNPGTWVHHCQVVNHRDMGMISKYTVA